MPPQDKAFHTLNRVKTCSKMDYRQLSETFHFTTDFVRILGTSLHNLAFPNTRQEESRSQSYKRPCIPADACVGASFRPSSWLPAATHSNTLIWGQTLVGGERRAMKGVSEEDSKSRGCGALFEQTDKEIGPLPENQKNWHVSPLSPSPNLEFTDPTLQANREKSMVETISTPPESWGHPIKCGSLNQHEGTSLREKTALVPVSPLSQSKWELYMGKV